MVKSAPRTMQTPPTTTYAIPIKGFWPPITVRVEISIDFVPPYSVTGKPTLPLATLVIAGILKRTVLNVELVTSRSHGCGVVSPRQFAKSRQCCGSHPYHELFILVKIGDSVNVSIRIAIMPIRRRDHLPFIVLGLLDQLLVAVPRYTFIRHVICLSIVAVQELGTANCVIE